MITRAGCGGGIPGGQCELLLGELQALGSPTPTRTLSLSPQLTLPAGVRVWGVLDHRGGHRLLNLTHWVRCGNVTATCREAHDPDAPLAHQARVAAGLQGNLAPYLEDASFWKLREVAVEVDLPARLTTAARLRDASLLVAGRNLATWTGYGGLDPEVNSLGPDGLLVADLFEQPPLRTVVMRLRIGR